MSMCVTRVHGAYMTMRLWTAAVLPPPQPSAPTLGSSRSTIETISKRSGTQGAYSVCNPAAAAAAAARGGKAVLRLGVQLVYQREARN